MKLSEALRKGCEIVPTQYRGDYVKENVVPHTLSEYTQQQCDGITAACALGTVFVAEVGLQGAIEFINEHGSLGIGDYMYFNSDEAGHRYSQFREVLSKNTRGLGLKGSLRYARFKKARGLGDPLTITIGGWIVWANDEAKWSREKIADALEGVGL